MTERISAARDALIDALYHQHDQDSYALVDAYTHEIADQLRADTRAGYRPSTTRYQHYMEAADHIDPHVTT